MGRVDWRELYASNRAAIERASGAPAARRAGSRPPVQPRRACARPRHAVVHAPAGVDRATAVPLVCMLHGCTQDAANFAAATRMNDAADRHGFAVVYPQQHRGANRQGCWNWFASEHQTRGTGEPASIAGIVRELIGTNAHVTIDSGRVFVAGFSAGGAMAAILSATYPDLFAAVAVHSGLAYGSATTLAGAFTAMARGGPDPVRQGRAAYGAMGDLRRPIPSIVIHGSSDRTVAPVNADHLLQQSMTTNRLAAPTTCDADVAHPSTTSRDTVRGGHSYARSRWTDRNGVLMHEFLRVDGLGHAWSGGTPGASYTDACGPDATEAIWEFLADATAVDRG